MQEVGTLIIGAGVSGLSYAAYTNEDYYIVEKENTPGGLCRTIHRDGFVWDFGGHFFHFARPELKLFFENGNTITVRPSGTEPKVKFYVGMKSKEKIGKENADKLYEEIKKALNI